MNLVDNIKAVLEVIRDKMNVHTYALIGKAEKTSVLLIDEAQVLTEQQKAIAADNLGLTQSGDGDRAIYALVGLSAEYDLIAA